MKKNANKKKSIKIKDKKNQNIVITEDHFQEMISELQKALHTPPIKNPKRKKK